MKHFKYILSLLVVFFIGLFFSKNVSAVSDYTFTITESTAANTLICSDDVSDNITLCSNYNYVKIESSFSQGTLLINYRALSPTTFNILYQANVASTSAVYTLGSVYKIRVGGSTGAPSTYTITLTFSENPFSDCPEPEPCPICSDSSAYIQVIIDAFWKYCIAFAGVIVSVIIIAFLFKFLRKVFK